MGVTAAQTVEEIESLRGRLDAELQALETRLPAPAVWTKRLAGVLAGGGMASTAFWFVVRRARSRSGKKQRMESVRLARPVIQVLPDDVADRLAMALARGAWRPWAVGVGSAWLVVKAVELRRLRRLEAAWAARG